MSSKILNFILFILAVPGQTALPKLPDAPDTSNASTASISGVVLRAPTETPLPKVTVDLRPADSTGVTSSTMTESDGRFIFPYLPPGEYQVIAIRSGYVTTSYGQRVPEGPGLSIKVSTGQRVDKLKITMTPSGTISGRVLGPDGTVGNAIVQALKATFQDGKPAFVPVKETVTNDLGEYRLFGLASGKYYVDVLARSETQGADSLVVNSQGTNGFSSGRAQIQLDAGRDNTPQRNESYVPTFYPGVVSRNSATPFDVVPGVEISNINIVATRVRAIHVRGTIVDDRSGALLPAGSLQLLPLDAPAKAVTLYLSSVTNRGAFDFPSVVPGSYILSVDYGEMSGRLTIEVRDRDIDNITLRMVAPIKIPFHVTVEGQNGKAADPSIVTSLSVGRGSNPSVSGLFGATRTLPAAGTGVLPGLLPGNYHLYIPPLLNWPGTRSAPLPPALVTAYVKSIRLGDMDILKDGLQIDRQPDGTIEIVIGTAPGVIAGRIQDAAGAPAQASIVVAMPNESRDYRIDLTHSTSTDAAGNFQLDGLPPGDYKLFAWDAIEKNAWLDPEFMREFEDLGHPFRISEGSSQIMILPVIQGLTR